MHPFKALIGTLILSVATLAIVNTLFFKNPGPTPLIIGASDYSDPPSGGIVFEDTNTHPHAFLHMTLAEMETATVVVETPEPAIWSNAAPSKVILVLATFLTLIGIFLRPQTLKALRRSPTRTSAKKRAARPDFPK